METAFNWISQNKEWLFSGGGILIIGIAYKFIRKSISSASTYMSEIAFNSTQIKKLFLEIDKLNLEFEQTKDYSSRKQIYKSAIKLLRNLNNSKNKQMKKLEYLGIRIGMIRGNMHRIHKMEMEYTEQVLKDKANSFYTIAEKEYQEMATFYKNIQNELEEINLKIRHLVSIKTAIEADKIKQ